MNTTSSNKNSQQINNLLTTISNNISSKVSNSIIPHNMSSEKSIIPKKTPSNSLISSIANLGEIGMSLAQMGSNFAGIMIVLATLQQYLPDIVPDFFQVMLARFKAFFRPEIQMTCYEYDAYSYEINSAYTVLDAYIAMLSMNASNNATRLKIDNTDKNFAAESLIFPLEDYEEITDSFEGIQFTWLLGKLQPTTKTVMSESPWAEEKRFFRLTFNRKYRHLVTTRYLRHVMETGETVLKKRRTRMLYTNNPSTDWASHKKGIWRKTVFEHPATFENLAIDPIKKDEIIRDLITFTKAKDYYKKIGKAWKRGYLLYGPPGTGKTTMIACMANLLGYNVYDVELTTVKNNSALRNLLISTTGKSIILIEDIDCTLPITAKRQKAEKDTKASKKSDDSEQEVSESDSDTEEESKGDNEADSDEDKGKEKQIKPKTEVTLSGLLNIIDGLWSPCSEERIIVFTTNHISKLDPALIRTGRMDKHIEMSYCTFEAFKIFAKNYLNIDYHPLFDRIEALLSANNVTPSDVAEKLLPKSEDENPGRRLEELILAIEDNKQLRK